MANTPPQTGCAPVNGVAMYYEIRGVGQPHVLRNGALGTIDSIVPGAHISRIATERSSFEFDEGGGNHALSRDCHIGSVPCVAVGTPTSLGREQPHRPMAG
jgi:hypothetical protein